MTDVQRPMRKISLSLQCSHAPDPEDQSPATAGADRRAHAVAQAVSIVGEASAGSAAMTTEHHIVSRATYHGVNHAHVGAQLRTRAQLTNPSLLFRGGQLRNVPQLRLGDPYGSGERRRSTGDSPQLLPDEGELGFAGLHPG